jgi:hypothetical protein
MVWLRLICAVLLAWAVNLVLAWPVAAALVTEIPEMAHLGPFPGVGPIAGAVVGFLAIPRRNGMGVIIATLNGAWSGLLVIALSGVIYLAIRMFDALIHHLLKDFEAFLRVLSTEAKPLIDIGIDPKLIGITVGATAVVGLLSEILSWCRSAIRRHRGLPEEKKQVRAAVARAGAHI